MPNSSPSYTRKNDTMDLWPYLKRRIQAFNTNMTNVDYMQINPGNASSVSRQWDSLMAEHRVRLRKHTTLIDLLQQCAGLTVEAQENGMVGEEFREAREVFRREYCRKCDENAVAMERLNEKIEARTKMQEELIMKKHKQKKESIRREMKQRRVELRERKIRHRERMRKAAKFEEIDDVAPQATGMMDMVFRPKPIVRHHPLAQPQHYTFRMALSL